jgi:hypothetical protein
MTVITMKSKEERFFLQDCKLGHLNLYGFNDVDFAAVGIPVCICSLTRRE